MDYTKLKNELAATHPITGAYNADDQLAADQLNEKNITRVRLSMSGAEVLLATDVAEYTALATPDLKDQWLSFTSHDHINPEIGGIAQQIVVDIFGGASVTVANLASLRDETISRAEELGLGKIIIGDVQNARAI